jgi:hypothetical protein
MKLPNQSKPVERKTYNANATVSGVNASFWGSTLKIFKKAVKGALNSL